MWSRKSDSQLAMERGNLWLSFRGPVALFVFCFATSILVTLVGVRHLFAQSWATRWSQVLNVAALTGAIAALANYVLQLVLGRKLDISAFNIKLDICDCCHRIKRRDGKVSCECGGKFDDFDNWEWTDPGKGDK
jgi:hypothetical protein